LQLGRRHGRGVQRRLTPGDFNPPLRKIGNAAIATVTALIVSRSHIDAVDRTRIDTQRPYHALGLVDLEYVDPEALAHRVLDLVNVNAIHRTGAGALVAANAGRQIEAMKTSITRPDRHGQLRVFKLMSERLSLVGLKE